MTGHGFKLKENRFRLHIRKERVARPWLWGCPEKLWLLYPWKCARPGWMGLGAGWSSGRCPWLWQKGGMRAV